MSFTVEKLEGGMAKLTITVDAATFEEALQKSYLKNRGKIQLPGFRKGKAPRNVIEKMYGKEVFYEDAANLVIPDAYDEALEACEEDIVSSPSIDVEQIEAGKDFIFTAEVALKPEVTLGKYKGIKVKAADLTVTEEELNAQLLAEQKKNARAVVVADRPVQDGDQTIIDFEGFVDGVAFEGGKGSDYPLTIGSGAFIPGFEEALIGAELNVETDVNVTFPEDYQAEELAGKAAVFKCTVKEIKEEELPELDDEFAGEVSEFDTLEAYKEDVKKTLLAQKEQAAKTDKEDAIIDTLIAEATMEIPDAMVETQARQMVDEFAQRIQAQGMTMDLYMQYTGMSVEGLLEQMKPQAVQRIKSRLVLEAVVKAENIEATEQEYEDEAVNMGIAYNMEADKVKEALGENGKKQVMEDICIKKALEFLVENAKETKPRKSSKKATEETAEA